MGLFDIMYRSRLAKEPAMISVDDQAYGIVPNGFEEPIFGFATRDIW
jgi:hypothetical protein